jgi:protein-S-isoprenylcysteine O-methyltransferase Ste14
MAGQKATELREWMQVGYRIALFVIFIVTCFAIAGRLDWIQAWAFFAVFIVYGAVVVGWLARSNPELLQERRQTGQNVEGWDKVVMNVYTVLLLLLFATSALDAGRYMWSEVPVALQAGAWAAMMLAGVAIWHVMAVNAYLSSMVRIQEDRGQEVVSKGLYGYVRHPMYASIIVFIMCVPLVLGSFWALIPGCLIAGLFVYRTAREDRTLTDKLPGYREYTQRVRYRLLPGVW